MAPGGHGGARDGAGAKKRVVEVQGDNPFSIAREFQERKKQRQLANQKEEEFERRKKVLEEPGWKCGVCTLDNNSDEAKLAGVCAVCGAERAQEDSEVTTTEENAGPARTTWESKQYYRSRKCSWESSKKLSMVFLTS